VNDMFSEANRAASMIRDMYEAFRRFGFSHDEAFALLLTVLSNGLRG